MAYLIILRGPMGSGKSSIATEIEQILGYENNTVILDLDRTGEEFAQEMQRALDRENVVIEKSDGASDTTDPQNWIQKFKDKGCIILSVILLSTLETCHKRVKKRSHDIATDDKIDLSFNTFYQKLLTVLAAIDKLENISSSYSYKIKRNSKKLIHELLFLLKHEDPHQVSLESGIPIAGVFCFVLFYVKHGVSKGTIHPYSVFNCYPCHQLHK